MGFIQTYWSLSEMVDAAVGPSSGYGRSSRQEGDQRWFGTENFDEAESLARNGWSKPRKRVQGIVSEVMDNGGIGWETIGTRVDMDVTGAVVDVGAYLSGEPECMMDFISSGETPTVRICAAASFLASVKREPVLKRGATICALIEALAASGVTVELWVSLSTRGRDGVYEMFTRVKASGDPLDIDQMMFVLAHASFARRIGFGAKESTPVAYEAGWHSGSGYGSSVVAQDFSTIGPCDLVIPPCSGSWDRIANHPIEWVRETVAKLKAGI